MRNLLLTGSNHQEKLVSFKTKIKDKCNLYENYSLNIDLKDEMDLIICFEGLNPRPDTLSFNIQQLKKHFQTEDLEKKMFIICYSVDSLNHDFDLEALRDNFLTFNEFFKNIGINSNEGKKTFVENRVWLIDGDGDKNYCGAILKITGASFETNVSYVKLESFTEKEIRNKHKSLFIINNGNSETIKTLRFHYKNFTIYEAEERRKKIEVDALILVINFGRNDRNEIKKELRKYKSFLNSLIIIFISNVSEMNSFDLEASLKNDVEFNEFKNVCHFFCNQKIDDNKFFECLQKVQPYKGDNKFSEKNKNCCEMIYNACDIL